MRVLSLFSGAGGTEPALEEAGYAVVARCEIEAHARAVLRYHWPDGVLHGDVTVLDGTQYRGLVGVVMGGSPCQDLSVAGKRAGLEGERSGLFHHQVRVWQESDATYCLWENVKGAFSSNRGADFAAVLSALVGAEVAIPHRNGRRGKRGWPRAGVVAGPTAVAAWRLLDLQHFGVPQRRERIVVLAARAGGVDPAEVLALGEGVCGDSPPRYEAREGAAAAAHGGAGTSSGGQGIAGTLGTLGTRGHQRPDDPESMTFVVQPDEVANCLLARDARGPLPESQIGTAVIQPVFPTLKENIRNNSNGGTEGDLSVVQPIAHTLRAEGHDASEDGTGRGTPLVVAVAHRGREGGASAELGADGVAFALRAPGGGSSKAEVIAPTLRVGGRADGAGDSHDNTPIVVAAFNEAQITHPDNRASVTAGANAPPLDGSGRVGVVDVSGLGVRMLLPLECERIMGWRDDWTRWGRREDGSVYELKDTPRYRLCGNGIGREWLEWIALRLIEAERAAPAVEVAA